MFCEGTIIITVVNGSRKAEVLVNDCAVRLPTACILAEKCISCRKQFFSLFFTVQYSCQPHAVY